MLKKFFTTAAVGIVLAGAAGAAAAQYPDRPITLIVPWAAGGGTDAIARELAQGMQKRLGVRVSVINRAGGGGVIGHNAIATASKDGYTIGLATAELVTYYWTGNAKFTQKNFTPIGLINFDAGALQVSAKSPWKTADQMLAAIRKAPKGTYKMSGTAVGAAYHLAFAGFLKQHGIDPLKVTMVPSQGAAPGLQELAAGAVQIIPSSLPEGKTMIQAGLVRALAVFSDKRNPVFPGVPTAKQATGKAYDGGTWRGVVGPADMNPAAAKRLAAVVKSVYDSASFQAFMHKHGYGMRYLGPAAFRKFLETQQVQVGGVLKSLGLAKRG